MPETFWHSPQPYTHPADDHQQKSAGGELVPDAQPTFEDLKHIHFSYRREAELFVEQNSRFQDLVHRIGLPG
jgi:hypothetical protein